MSRRNIDTSGQLLFGLGGDDPLTRSLQDSFDRWDQLNKYGGSDPCWADGINMNLVRSHIMYYKSQMENKYGSGEYPDIYYRETPSEVPPDFMANPEQIRADATAALQIIEADENLKFIRDNIGGLTDKQRQALCVGAVLGYVQNLKHYISGDDLVSMRRYQDPKWVLDSFQHLANRLSQPIPESIPVQDSDSFEEEYEDEECEADDVSEVETPAESAEEPDESMQLSFF
ncbi:MAG: hypothetical protein J6X60_01815 [Ruminiclostridium sp.]|nr:hypothetical protein [Ruminiclostridium sp.]